MKQICYEARYCQYFVSLEGKKHYGLKPSDCYIIQISDIYYRKKNNTEVVRLAVNADWLLGAPEDVIQEVFCN